jgi:HTH-type transcriptional regulator / antitoxin HigA
MPVEENDFRTPGQLIRALLKDRGWSQEVLALVLGVNQSVVARLATDKRPVDAARALALAEVFDIPAERFLDLQRNLDLAQARIVNRPDPARANRAQLLGGLPVAEMISRGWLDAVDIRQVETVEAALAKFFGVTEPDQIETLPHAAKRTNVAGKVTPTQLAWLYRVRQIASEMLVPRYSPGALRAAMPRLQALLSAPEEARKAPRILAECGIRFVLVESLAGAKIDGVCFWLNDFSPVIGMSLRYDRIDHFWFVLRHEIEHCLRGHGRGAIAIDSELDRERAGTGDNVSEEERMANVAASDFCVPAKQLQQFVARKAPMFAERDIIGFANTLNVHPGVVAGQLQHYLARYDRFRSHLVKIRHAVAPSAVVDGWGDVAPVGM